MATRRPAAAPARAAYHHGNLREALVEAAVQIMEEQGLEKLSVREAAKRAGVSPGAPFRHFATRSALLTEVAQQATRRLHRSVEAAIARAADRPALERMAAIGHAYLTWAMAHPTQFRVISDRRLLDDDALSTMTADNQAIRDHMRTLLAEILGAQSTAGDIERAQLASRALVYGLARMAVDGHFPEWRLRGQSTQGAVATTLDFFIALLRDARTPR